jgi:flagellar basal body-associated protein FliL
MADEKPKPAEEHKPADAAAHAPKSGGGIGALLPLILTPVLCAGAAFGVFQFVIKPGLTKSLNEAVAKAVAEQSGGDTHGKTDDGHGAKKDDGHGAKKGDGHGKADDGHGTKKDDKKDDKKKADKAGPPSKEDDPNEPVAVSERTVANVANTGGQRYLVVKIALIRGEAKDLDFSKRVEKYRDRLDAAANSVLSSKTLEELEKPGIRTLVKAELQGEFNRVLGHASVKEILFPVWVLQ